MGELSRMYSIVKAPEFENDDLLVKFPAFKMNYDSFNHLKSEDEYLNMKWLKFLDKDTTYKGFEKFKDLPSMRGYKEDSILTSVIYTKALEIENGVEYNYHLIRSIANELKKKGNRRVILRFLNSYPHYTTESDVSCLAFIQLIKNDDKISAKIVYRASDIKNEFFYDVLLIYDFFISVVTSDPVDISFYATTAQNINALQEACIKIDSLR